MRKILSVITLSLYGFFSYAQQTTTDYLTLDGITAELNVGGSSQRAYVKLNGSEIKYSGYNLDLYLPYGLEFDVTSKGALRVNVARDIQPYTETEEEDEEGEIKVTKEYTHTFSFEDKGNGHVRIACMSLSNEDFTKTSGRLFSFYVKATSPYVNSNAKIQAKGIALSTSSAIEYDPDDCFLDGIRVSADREIPLNVYSEVHWSTCILPFSADIPDGVKAYTCTKNDETYIYLTEAESFEAYTPYILYSESGFSGTISGTVDAEKYPESGVVKSGYLNGAIVPQTATEGYVLQKQDEDVKFYAIADGDSFAIPAGKCWMTLPEGAKANALSFKLEDAAGMTTAIIPASTLTFDLSGRQTTNDKGLLIRDGKKTIKY